MIQFPPSSENVLLKAVSYCATQNGTERLTGVRRQYHLPITSPTPPESSSRHIDCFGSEVEMTPRIEATKPTVQTCISASKSKKGLSETSSRIFFQNGIWTLEDGQCQGSSSLMEPYRGVR